MSTHVHAPQWHTQRCKRSPVANAPVAVSQMEPVWIQMYANTKSMLVALNATSPVLRRTNSSCCIARLIHRTRRADVVDGSTYADSKKA